MFHMIQKVLGGCGLLCSATGVKTRKGKIPNKNRRLLSPVVAGEEIASPSPNQAGWTVLVKDPEEGEDGAPFRTLGLLEQIGRNKRDLYPKQ